MKPTVEKVNCLNRNTVPPEGETIADDFEIEKMAPLIHDMTIYLRKKEDCPFNRGNWMIDIRLINGALWSLKLPKEMKKAEVMNHVQPLIDSLKKINNSMDESK